MEEVEEKEEVVMWGCCTQLIGSGGQEKWRLPRWHGKTWIYLPNCDDMSWDVPGPIWSLTRNVICHPLVARSVSGKRSNSTSSPEVPPLCNSLLYTVYRYRCPAPNEQPDQVNRQWDQDCRLMLSSVSPLYALLLRVRGWGPERCHWSGKPTAGREALAKHRERVQAWSLPAGLLWKTLFPALHGTLVKVGGHLIQRAEECEALHQNNYEAALGDRRSQIWN